MRQRIMVVEDDDPSRRLLRAILVARGHEVIEADRVDGARALLDSRPDLILVDLQLPDGDGGDVLRDVRCDPALAAVPVVVVTAQAMAGDRERLLAIGFDAYVSKPIDTRTFGMVVEAMMGRRGVAT